MSRIILALFILLVIWSCRSGHTDEQSESNKQQQAEVTVSNPEVVEPDNEVTESIRSKPQPQKETISRVKTTLTPGPYSRLSHSAQDGTFKIFDSNSTVIYQSSYEGSVLGSKEGGFTTEVSLYFVYLEVEAGNSFLIICIANESWELLEVVIPPDVPGYEDFHSGGIHSSSPSNKLLALDFGTGSDRWLRVYDLEKFIEAGSITYNSISGVSWDDQDRLVYYDRGHLPDSLRTLVSNHLTPDQEENLSEAYIARYYEKVWDYGTISYTGIYVKTFQE